MSQTPSQEPLDLIQTNHGTGHDTTNTERMPFPKPNSTQEQPASSSQPQTVAHEPLEDSSTQPRSSSLPAPSSKTAVSSEAPSATNPIPNTRKTPTDQAQQPPEDADSSKDPLHTYAWAELEQRFHTEMEKCATQEHAIQAEFNNLLKLFKTYTFASCLHEETRAGKRLRTRMAYVQQREKTLEEKRMHYEKVVEAFEIALALL